MKAGTKLAKAANARSNARSTARAKGAGRGAARVAKRPQAKALKPEPRPPKAQGHHVRDVMTPDPVCATSGSNLRDVARLLDEYEISGLPVVDDQDRLIGVISRTDLLRRLLEGPPTARRDEDWLDLLTADSATSVDVDVARLGTVDDLMSVDPIIARTEETLARIARRMADERVHRLVVVDENRHPIGILTTLDVLKYFPA
jgi:CBS domain-containing protein